MTAVRSRTEEALWAAELAAEVYGFMRGFAVDSVASFAPADAPPYLVMYVPCTVSDPWEPFGTYLGVTVYEQQTGSIPPVKPA